MPQPVTYNPGTPVSGSIQENSISYVVDGQNRNYRGGFGGLSWMSEVPAANNVIFIGNSVSLGRGPANIPLFYPSYNNSAANIIYAANTLPGSPRNFTTTGSAYDWAATNNFFINNSNNPIPRIDADGLGLYLDASQPTSYPQTGTSVYDLSGRNNNGTLTNGVSWIASSGSFFFDGTDDYVSLGNLGTIGDNQTIEVWFNSNSVTSYKNVLDMNYSTYSPNTGNVGPRLEQYSSGEMQWYWSGNTTNNNIYNASATTPLLANRWYHTIFTLNSGTYNWYVNGTLINTGGSAQGYVTTYGDVNLGRGFILDPARYFSGLESSARIYSRTLSTSDVKQNYFQGNIVTGSLVFMVDANNLVSYPKSGTTWYALTGSVAGSSLNNGPTFDPTNGGTIRFDGTDTYVNVPYTSSLDITNAITVEAWVKYFAQGEIGGAGRTYSVISYKGYPWTWLLEDISGQFNFRISTTSDSDSRLDSNYYHGLNNWDHVVCTYNGTTQAIYVNGILQNSKNLTGTIITSGTTIELGTYSSGDYSFNGWLANHRIYNKALTPTEVQQNYQATKDKFLGQNIVTNGLVAYVDATNKDSYPGTGTTWYDLSGNGNNFTFSSTPNVLNGLFNSGASVFAYRNAIPVDSSVNGYTLEACFKLNSSTGGGYQNITQNGGGDPTRHMMWYNGGSNSFLALFHTPNFYNNISDTLSLNTWYYLQLSYNPSGGGSNGRRAWLNGVEKTVNNTAVGNGTPSGYFTISVDSDLVSNKSDTSYAFVRYYNRYLTEAEILQNYNATKTRFGF